MSVLAFAGVAGVAGAAEVAPATMTLEEIVVTAQKRTESIQDVPVTVTAVDADLLDQQNITTVADLSRAVPSISNNGGIRGVATGGFTISSEQAVSVVLDGVVMGRTAISNLFDIERVEVLSGPQGMLFGKNASAGVIHIVTNAPDPTQFEVIGSADFGNYEYERERLTVNAPLGSTAAVRVSLHNNAQGGWIHNNLSGNEYRTESYGGRARFLWEPTDNLSINLIGDWEKSTNAGEQAYAFAIAEAPSVVGLLAACGIVASPDNQNICAEGVHATDSTNKGVSAQIDYTFANDYVLTSITAQRRNEAGDTSYSGLGGDTDTLSENILSTNIPSGHDETFSQELRLTSPDDQVVEFVAGLYYYESENYTRSIQAGRLGVFAPILDALYFPGAITGRGYHINVDWDGWAAFGQSTIHLNDQWSLIAGGRYTEESLHDVARAFTPAELAAIDRVYFPPFSGTFPNIDETVDSENFSWRLGLQYDWNPDVMAFFTVARGYKGPAANDSAIVTDPIIDEEIPTNYELGVRANLFGQIFAAATAFYTKVEDFQTTVYVPASPANPVPGFANGNAPYIETQGVDLQMYGALTDNLTFNAGVIYTDAQYAPDFLVACSPFQNVTGACPPSGTTPSVGNLQNVSDWRVLLSGEYVKPIGSVDLFVQSDIVFETGYSTSSSPDPIQTMPDRTFLGGRIGVRSPEGRWGVSVWGRNLLDKYYPAFTPDPLGGFNGGGGTSYWVIQSPNLYRTYGLSVDFRF